MSDQQFGKMYELLVGVSATQEQMLQSLESIDKRLSNLEIKMSKVEKFVALENADFDPTGKRTS